MRGRGRHQDRFVSQTLDGNVKSTWQVCHQHAPEKPVTNTRHDCDQHLTRLSTTPAETVTNTWRNCHLHLTRLSSTPDEIIAYCYTWRECYQILTTVTNTLREYYQHLTRLSPTPNKTVAKTPGCHQQLTGVTSRHTTSQLPAPDEAVTDTLR